MRAGKVVEWEILEEIVHGAVSRKAKGPGGKPRFDPLLMFEVLVLQRLHGLASKILIHLRSHRIRKFFGGRMRKDFRKSDFVQRLGGRDNFRDRRKNNPLIDACSVELYIRTTFIAQP